MSQPTSPEASGLTKTALLGSEPPRIAMHVEAASDLELRPAPARVLGIGSRLAYGSVGLNVLEETAHTARVPMAFVPTILLPVMPHYASARALPIDPTWLGDALADLATSGVLSALEMMTVGYLASSAQAETIAHWWSSRTVGAGARFVLDPTLGDTELGFYTDPALVRSIRDVLLPLADGLTPNLFELSHLAERPLEDLRTADSIESAARSLMSPKTSWVAVTGIDIGDRPGSHIGEMVVTPSQSRFRSRPMLRTSAKGLGDVFTAHLSIALLRGDDISSAVESAGSEVLNRITLRNEEKS